MSPTNEERSLRARQALEVVAEYDPDDPDSIVDLVTDLLHLARRQEDIEPEYVLRMAKRHFEDEEEGL
jgi:hypothetical protein